MEDLVVIGVRDGYLVAGKGQNNDKIYVSFMSIDGEVSVCLTAIEVKSEKLNVYCFKDVKDDDYTEKYQLNIKEILESRGLCE